MDQRDNVQKKLPKLLDKVSEVLRTSNVYRFWSDFDRILIEMKNLFECRGIVVFLTQNGETKMVSSCGGFSLYDHDISGDKLVTSTIEAYGVPHNLCIKEAMENPACPACWKAIDIYPDIDPDIATVLFEKSKLGKRVLHFILFFDSTFHCTEIHQIYRKKEILSQVIHETINIFSSLEKIQGLKDSLKEREKILKEKEQFLKDIAHQFRQPLQGISSYCENLLSPIFSEERKKRIPSYLIDRVRHLSILTKSVEYASRGQENIFSSEKLKPTPHMLGQVLIEFAISMQGYAEEEEIHIHVEQDNIQEIGLVIIDKLRLEIALVNVLFNAVKYSFPKTHISISAHHDNINNNLLIYVTNYGIHIPINKWKSIFNRGVRTPLAIQYSQSGLGIGLFVTREILKLMGGDAFVVESSRTGGRHDDFDEYKNTIALSLPDTEINKVG